MNSDKHNQRRLLKDKLARWLVSAGGLGLIALVMLIFFYLLAEVLPLFASADVKLQQQFSNEQLQRAPKQAAALQSAPLMLELDEQQEVLMRVQADGQIVFQQLADGSQLSFASAVGVPALLAQDRGAKGLFALANSSGEVMLQRYRFKDDFSSGTRRIQPELTAPYGAEALQLGLRGSLQSLAIREFQERLLVASVDSADGLRLFSVDKSTNLFTDELSVNQQELDVASSAYQPQAVAISGNQRWLFTRADDSIRVYRISASGVSQYSEQPISGVLSWHWLLGQNSLLLNTERGVEQWAMLDYGAERGFVFSKIRNLHNDRDWPLSTVLLPAMRSKSFVLQDNSRLVFANTTAEKVSLNVELSELRGKLQAAALSPRGDGIFIITDAGGWLYQIDNSYPEISMSVLWAKVWYEDYPQPEFIWQSSAASDDFEPKLSLVPLSYGTLKSAFYAMLIAAPLAVLAAIYTSYFMAPALRRKIKPAVELMEAVPTVILGFVAGLFLAPFVENNLGAIILLVLLAPAFILLAGYSANWLPSNWRYRLNDGWHIAYILPALALFTWLVFAVSPVFEQAVFGASAREWVSNELGIDYDQRNALVVGLAMGFAVIPSIFSVAEDALFGVPNHLSRGSLALGANMWQTLLFVVLPTASPGIFSALSIGFGRAVGETMIVLMATGNTPIMDANIFTGMRTLSANIAVEIPESVVGSSHFRVLFLSGLILFAFTFLLNTLAEFVRQNLRKKYGSL